MFFLDQIYFYHFSAYFCHLPLLHPKFYPVYFLSFILYSSQSPPIFVHLFSDNPLSFSSSHTTPFPHRLFPVIYKLAVNFTSNFFQSNPSHFQTHIIVCERVMKNDKYYGSLRSRDNQWGVGFELIQRGILLSLLPRTFI